MKAMKRPIVVEVEGPLVQPRTVMTPHGMIPAGVGDYVLENLFTGDRWPIKSAIFAATYDVLDEETGTKMAKGTVLPGGVIQRIVHDYLVNNAEDLIRIGVALDRTYLKPWIGQVFGDENIPEILRAVAEAFIAEGLDQTS